MKLVKSGNLTWSRLLVQCVYPSAQGMLFKLSSCLLPQQLDLLTHNSLTLHHTPCSRGNNIGLNYINIDHSCSNY